MLKCWSCDSGFIQRRVWKDSIIRSRAAHNGGPYRLYRCPMCLKISRVESTPRGRLFASPDKEIGIFDYLFGWIEALEPDDFLRIAQWHKDHADRRRAFFLRDGDSRYTKGRWFDRARAWAFRRFRRGVVEGNDSTETDFADDTDERQQKEPRRPEEEPRRGREEKASRAKPTGPLPHPYRILGVSREATEAEIRAAFRRLARQWHPDKQRGSTPEELERASRRLAELVAAFEELTGRSEK